MMALRLEFKKMRHKHALLLTLLFLGFILLWQFWMLADQKPELRAQGNHSLLYQLPMLNVIILPIYAAVLATRLCDIEHRADSFKQLFVLQRPAVVFAAKLVYLALYNLVLTGLEAAAVTVLGRIYHFTDEISAGQLAVLLLTQWGVTTFISLLLQVIALYFANQFVPFAAGLVFAFLGLLSMFFPPVVMRLVPSAYYGLLATVWQQYTEATRTIVYYERPFSFLDAGILLAVFVALYLLGRHAFCRKEV